MEKIISKSLDGTEYELYNPYFIDNEKENQVLPEQIIIPFSALGIGMRIQMKENNKDIQTGLVIMPDTRGSAVITKIYEQDGKFIIIAKEDTKKEDKLKYANEVVKEIDFTQGLGNERFIEMLANVFTEQQLKKLFEADDIELLLFDSLMYLKFRDKAYRL